MGENKYAEYNGSIYADYNGLIGVVMDLGGLYMDLQWEYHGFMGSLYRT